MATAASGLRRDGDERAKMTHPLVPCGLAVLARVVSLAALAQVLVLVVKVRRP